MRVLIVGSGGREHALAWKISQSPQLTKLFAAPGNPGIAALATCVDTRSNDVEALVQVAQELNIDLVVIGPEEPLALGLADRLAEVGILVFGPRQAGARLESSKAWAKDFMQRHAIPTASFARFTDYQEALSYVDSHNFPLVIKASGLAAGKGVVIASSSEQAKLALQSMLLDHGFGAAGQEVVIEEYLRGQELSVLALVDGKEFLMLPEAQDHKQVFDGDQGPNTGGMGAYSPVPLFDRQLSQEIVEQILQPTIKGLQAEGIAYRGVLYLGLMLTEAGPKVIEYNCRFGDPETQVILPRIQGDLLTLIVATCRGNLSCQRLDVSNEAAAAVIMAAPGYPGDYAKGLPVNRLDQAAVTGCLIFQAGTSVVEDRLVSSGGRILAVVGRGQDMHSALNMAYHGVSKVYLPGAHYRKDIGRRVL